MNTITSIEKIIVGNRHRKNLGGITDIARNVEKIGLLHPIVVTPAGVLIAGERRLAACKSLGLTDIPATVVDLEDTHFEAPVGGHSAKPDIFFNLVGRASYLPAGEAFQRTPRPGFVNMFPANNTGNPIVSDDQGVHHDR